MFVEKVHAIKDHTNVSVRIMMDPLHFDRTLKFFNGFEDTKLFIEPVRVFNFIDGYATNTYPAGVELEHNYTEEQISILNALELINKA